MIRPDGSASPAGAPAGQNDGRAAGAPARARGPGDWPAARRGARHGALSRRWPNGPTPRIDALAAGGMKFTEAYLTASSCSPSRSSIITGRYPHNNGPGAELHQPVAANIPWLPVLLRESGYHTAVVGKNHMTRVDSKVGAETWDVIDPGVTPDNHGAESKWVETIGKRPKDKPFFFLRGEMNRRSEPQGGLADFADGLRYLRVRPLLASVVGCARSSRPRWWGTRRRGPWSCVELGRGESQEYPSGALGAGSTCHGVPANASRAWLSVSSFGATPRACTAPLASG